MFSDQYFTAMEAAKELGIHIRTLKQWNSDGTGPQKSYMGKKLCYKKSDLQKFLENLPTTPQNGS